MSAKTPPKKLIEIEPAKRTPKKCSNCGDGYMKRSARAGRVLRDYKGFDIVLPHDHVLKECESCGEISFSHDDMQALSDLIEAEYRRLLNESASRSIDAILAKKNITVASLERSLNLSLGYLSRVRNGSTDGGRPLAMLLALLADSPKQLDRFNDLLNAQHERAATNKATRKSASPKRPSKAA